MKDFIIVFTQVFALVILFVSVINIYSYYSDIKKIHELEKQKLRLEIEKLKRQIAKL
jgi:hypothetical protein